MTLLHSAVRLPKSAESSEGEMIARGAILDGLVRLIGFFEVLLWALQTTFTPVTTQGKKGKIESWGEEAALGRHPQEVDRSSCTDPWMTPLSERRDLYGANGTISTCDEPRARDTLSGSSRDAKGT